MSHIQRSIHSKSSSRGSHKQRTQSNPPSKKAPEKPHTPSSHSHKSSSNHIKHHHHTHHTPDASSKHTIHNPPKSDHTIHLLNQTKDHSGKHPFIFKNISKSFYSSFLVRNPWISTMLLILMLVAVFLIIIYAAKLLWASSSTTTTTVVVGAGAPLYPSNASSTVIGTSTPIPTQSSTTSTPVVVSSSSSSRPTPPVSKSSSSSSNVVVYPTIPANPFPTGLFLADSNGGVLYNVSSGWGSGTGHYFAKLSSNSYMSSNLFSIWIVGSDSAHGLGGPTNSLNSQLCQPYWSRFGFGGSGWSGTDQNACQPSSTDTSGTFLYNYGCVFDDINDSENGVNGGNIVLNTIQSQTAGSITFLGAGTLVDINMIYNPNYPYNPPCNKINYTVTNGATWHVIDLTTYAASFLPATYFLYRVTLTEVTSNQYYKIQIERTPSGILSGDNAANCQWGLNGVRFTNPTGVVCDNFGLLTNEATDDYFYGTTLSSPPPYTQIFDAFPTRPDLAIVMIGETTNVLSNIPTYLTTIVNLLYNNTSPSTIKSDIIIAPTAWNTGALSNAIYSGNILLQMAWSNVPPFPGLKIAFVSLFTIYNQPNAETTSSSNVAVTNLGNLNAYTVVYPVTYLNFKGSGLYAVDLSYIVSGGVYGALPTLSTYLVPAPTNSPYMMSCVQACSGALSAFLSTYLTTAGFCASFGGTYATGPPGYGC